MSVPLTKVGQTFLSAISTSQSFPYSQSCPSNPPPLLKAADTAIGKEAKECFGVSL